MAKKIIYTAIVAIFILSTISAYAAQQSAADSLSQPMATGEEKTKDRLSRGVNNLFYGPTEIADNLNQTNTKGAKVPNCNEKTRTGVERGIARIGAGIWQVLTFWYSDPGCVTSTKKAASK